MKSTFIIKENNIFRYILKKGRYAKGKFLVVHIYNKNIVKEQPDNTNFLGICVSKKNGNSVERNKFKRWVREIYKNEEENIKKNLNIVILLKKTSNIENLDYNKIFEDIIKCFRELEMYEKIKKNV